MSFQKKPISLSSSFTLPGPESSSAVSLLALYGPTLAATRGNLIERYTRDRLSPLPALTLHSNPITVLSGVSQPADLLVSADTAGVVALWRARETAPCATWSLGRAVSAAALSAHATWLACSVGPFIYVLRTSDTSIQPIVISDYFGAPVIGLAFDPALEGRLAAVAEDGTVCVFDVEVLAAGPGGALAAIAEQVGVDITNEKAVRQLMDSDAFSGQEDTEGCVGMHAVPFCPNPGYIVFNGRTLATADSATVSVLELDAEGLEMKAGSDVRDVESLGQARVAGIAATGRGVVAWVVEKDGERIGICKAWEGFAEMVGVNMSDENAVGEWPTAVIVGGAPGRPNFSLFVAFSNGKIQLYK